MTHNSTLYFNIFEILFSSLPRYQSVFRPAGPFFLLDYVEWHVGHGAMCACERPEASFFRANLAWPAFAAAAMSRRGRGCLWGGLVFPVNSSSGIEKNTRY
jgi:hypothetical protein